MGGLAEGVWESPALLQSGLRMAKGQALLAFPWHFQPGNVLLQSGIFPKQPLAGRGGHVWFR